MPSNINTEIYDGRLNRAALLRLYERNTIGKIEVVMDGHVVRLDNLIKKSKLKASNFKSFQTNLNKELKRTYREAFAVSKRSLLDLASDQVSFTYQNLEAGMSKVWRTKRPQRRISEDIVLKQPLHSNKTLEQGWAGIGNSERKRLSQVIRRGIANGDTPEVIARDVRRGSVHKITRNQSRALVTTSITSVSAQADQAVYQANEQALQGWQYVAVLDSRTTQICSHRDGKIYPVNDTKNLPPAHFNCRSTTTPIVKKWDDLAKLEGVNQVRKRNLKKLTPAQIAAYDGQTPLKESYNQWLLRQPQNIQLKHLGDYKKVELFNRGKLNISKFSAPDGAEVGIRQLRRLTDSEYSAPGDTRRFALAKERLDAMQLGAASPDDFISDTKLTNTLRDYYTLQSRELDGTLSLTNYRGNLIGSKKRTKNLVLTKLPRDDQLLYNPITGRYDDARIFQPNPAVLENSLRLVNTSDVLKAADKKYITNFIGTLDSRMSINERAAVAENLRILFTRYRKNPEVWTNFKAIAQSQIKFDVMNVSDSLETQLRQGQNILRRLKENNYIDPVLGPVQLDELSKNFIPNIVARNKWEDKVAPKIALQLRDAFDRNIPVRLRPYLGDDDLQQFYLRFAHRLSLADSPDLDNLAVSLGRDLYNLANQNGTKRQWYNTGKKLLESNNKFFKLETFGVQKRRMKNKLSGQYFGPYYDTFSYNIRITDPRIQTYAKLNRSIDVGLRIGVTDPKNRLIFREGFKTYFYKDRLGLYRDTRIPITSSSSFRDFPEEFIDKDMVNALNWAAKSEFKVDEDYYDFVNKLLNFSDDRGRAKYFDDLNEYRKYIVSRGDSYERFKAMEWFRRSGRSFSNHPFIDSRARIYDRGFIGPQSGETFRPFLSTPYTRNFSETDYLNFNDQIGAFLGGLDDFFEGRFNSLSITGRQKIARKYRDELVRIGNHMRRGRPNDIRAVLQNSIAARIDGEELGKFYRFAIEAAKIDDFLGGDYSKRSLSKLKNYKTSLALEQDASSSGAQIIALTTKNKQLAELSNVVPTNQKRRLYDEIAAATYNDSRFRKLNERLGLNEKDLRKAAKAQNMVTFYGAGDRTGILNVERKLASALDRQPGVLVVKASERDKILNEISARIARFEKFDPDIARELTILRTNVRDTLNKGLNPGDEIMEQLWFLSPETKEFLERMSVAYERVITPNDFKEIALIMSEYLAEQAPVLKSYTKFLGKAAEAFLLNAKPSKSDFDWKGIAKYKLLGTKESGYKLPSTLARLIGVDAKKSVSEQFLEKFGFWKPNGTLSQIIYGVPDPTNRRLGAKYFKFEVAKLVKFYELEVFRANKLPKSWTNIPWVNFDNKTLEQNFTSTVQTRLFYRDKDGNPINNILNIDHKTEATWWEQLINDSGNINDIADVGKAKTAFAVNGTHSNDAVFVKRFHLWGRDSNIGTATVHDAFFTNVADMLKARRELRSIYARAAESNTIKNTLDEMRKRGLPKTVYDELLKEAIELGLIPIPGKSRIGGRLLRDTDILKRSDILKDIDEVFEDDLSWYGVG